MSSTSQDSAGAETRGLSPEAAGKRLREARERRGLSLEEMHKASRVPLKHLEALETGRLDVFPAPLYVRGALQTFCEQLDLDFEEYREILPGTEVRVSPVSEEMEADTGDEVRALWPLYALGGGILLLGLIGWFAASRPAKAPVVAEPATPSVPGNFAKPEEQVRLGLSYAQNNRAKVVCDGVVQFEGKVPAGHSQNWSASETVVFRFEDPQSVSFTLDGHEVKVEDFEKDRRGDFVARVRR